MWAASLTGDPLRLLYTSLLRMNDVCFIDHMKESAVVGHQASPAATPAAHPLKRDDDCAHWHLSPLYLQAPGSPQQAILEGVARRRVLLCSQLHPSTPLYTRLS